MNKKEVESELRCQIVRGIDSVAMLTRDWDDLFKRAQKAPPFYSRAWVQTFISENNIKGTPLLVTVWSDSKLVALLPLTISSYCGIKVAMGTPTTTLCCTGILADPNYQEAIRVIAETWVQEKIAHAFYNKYTTTKDEFTNKLFAELTRHGFVCRHWHRHIGLQAHLEPTFEMCLKTSRTRKQREKLLYHERRVFKSGDVKVVRYTDEQITPEITKRIADIQENSWVKAQGAAVLGQPFYQKLLIEMGKADIGCVWLMTKDGDDIAFLYASRVHNSLYPKWMAYKLEHGSSSTLSFGKVLYMQMVRDACNEGIDLIDLGFGKDKWKRLWATDRYIIDTFISGHGLIGRVAVICCWVIRKCTRFKWLLHKRFRKFRMTLKQKC